MVFEGKITRIKNCTIVFKAEGSTYHIPASEIFSLQFENIEDKVYTSYLKLAVADPNKCFSGRLDAGNYHSRKGQHFTLGLLFGPFAMIGTAISNPTPQRGVNTVLLSENSNQFNDPEYLSCG